MEDIFVGRVMSSGIHTVSPDTSVEEAANNLLDNEIGSVVVVDEDNQPAGILTSTDFVRIVAERQPKDDSAVTEFMTQDVVTTSAQESIREAADKLIEHGISHLPVVDEEEGVIGMLSSTDLTAYLSALREPSPA